jgi:uncharacterized paraquat-inducible protein A
VAFERSDPRSVEPVSGISGGVQEHIRVQTRTVLAHGTMACPECDAPVAPDGPITPAVRLQCPYCSHHAAARDFLSLDAPTRPARVELRVVPRRR